MPSDLRSLSATTYASRTDTTITAPAGIADNDVLVIAHVCGANTAPPARTPPAGFVPVPVSGAGTLPVSMTSGGFGLEVDLWWKRAAGESGDYTVTHDAAACQGAMLCILGGDTGASPSVTLAQGTGTTSTAGSITTTVDASLIAFIAQNWQLYGTADPPAGATPTFVEQLDAATSLMYIATGALATAGATGDKSHANLNLVNDPWSAYLLTMSAIPDVTTASEQFLTYPWIWDEWRIT